MLITSWCEGFLVSVFIALEFIVCFLLWFCMLTVVD